MWLHGVDDCLFINESTEAGNRGEQSQPLCHTVLPRARTGRLGNVVHLLGATGKFPGAVQVRGEDR